MSDFWLIIFCFILLANAYCMIKFWQALRAFTKSQNELIELMERVRQSR